jgi:tetratricopeptide (TPR) repeat protein
MRPLHRVIRAVVLLSPATCWAQKSATQQWQELLGKGQIEEARTLCTTWASSDEISRRVDAYKCLANVSLRGKQVLALEGNEAGGGVLRGAFTPEAVDEALGYLKKGLELAPQDLSIHQGRLHLLKTASRFEEMATALDKSCRIYKGKEGVAVWIAYTGELFEDRQYSASLDLLKVLQKYFPNSHDVMGNTGSVYLALKKDDEALPYLRKAVELAPDDSIDAWNLARLYDLTGKTKEADISYQKALQLKWEDASDFQNSRCLYAGFIEQKLNDFGRACMLERTDCPADKQTACSKLK